MHASVMTFVATSIPSGYATGRTVLEVGSYNVNGSVRTIIEPQKPSRYVGVDMREGPGVDVVCKAEDMPDDLTSDIVVSAEMLEHAPDWIAAFKRMVELCNGLFVLTARGGKFMWHDYPGDYHRFSTQDFAQACKAVGVRPIYIGPDPQADGVFLAADCTNKINGTNEWPTALTTEQALGPRR